MVPLLLRSPPLPSRQLPNLFVPRPLPSLSRIRTLHLRPFPALLPTRQIPHAASIPDQELLDALSGSDPDGDARTHLPAVRSFENDLSRLTLIGPVAVNQAITAAAADGGGAADEHLASGTATMVVETVFPGNLGECSTVSTRLFLPAKKVKEKAKRLKVKLGPDFSSQFSTRNILARTFRQVVLQSLWSFELLVYPPGSERDMADLANPREMQGQFTISSSDEGILTALAEVVCVCALNDLEREHARTIAGTAPRSIFGLFQKPIWTVSADSSVSICRLSKSEVIDIAKRKVKVFNISKKTLTDRKREAQHKWWLPPTYSDMDKNGGVGFTDWIYEHMPIYRIQVDVNKLKDAKFRGWQSLDSADNRFEALLTHFQLVELANILDMFFEDQYTTPENNFPCHWVSRSSNVSKGKTSIWKTVILALAFGFVVVSFGVLARLYSSKPFKAKTAFEKHNSVSTVNLDYCLIQYLDADEMESLCISIIQRIKNALDRPEAILVERTVGVWMGELPGSLRRAMTTDVGSIVSNSGEANRSQMPIVFNGKDARISQTDASFQMDTSASAGSSVEENTETGLTSAQDIGSYQVVLLQDGEIVGFQPTNRVAVNNWATNPLAKILYGGAKLSPGLFEPSLKIPPPNSIVLIELFLSVKPESWFALARPVQ